MNQEKVGPGKKLPSVMRYDRVQSILEGDLALKDFLGPKGQEVEKRNGEKYLYSQGVILVTNALHERGFDAHNVDKDKVLLLASELLRDKKLALKAIAASKPEPGAKSQESKVEEAKPAPKPKPAPKSKPAPKPKPKPVPKSASQKIKPRSVKPKASAASAASPVAAVSVHRNDSLPAPAPATIDGQTPKSGYVYYTYGTALGLAVTLHRTLEIGDRMPGAEARLEAVGKIIDQLKPMANVGVPMPDDFNNAMKHVNAANSKG